MHFNDDLAWHQNDLWIRKGDPEFLQRRHSYGLNSRAPSKVQRFLGPQSLLRGKKASKRAGLPVYDRWENDNSLPVLKMRACRGNSCFSLNKNLTMLLASPLRCNPSQTPTN